MAVIVAITGIVPGNGTNFTPPTSAPASAVADITQRQIIVDGTFTLSGSYGTGTSHGDPVDFTAPAPPFSFGEYAPAYVNIIEMPQAGVAALGYQYIYCPGPTLAAPTQAGGVLQILGAGAGSGQGGTEITEGSAYSGFTPSLSGAVLRFRAWFVRL